MRCAPKHVPKTQKTKTKCGSRTTSLSGTKRVTSPLIFFFPHSLCTRPVLSTRYSQLKPLSSEMFLRRSGPLQLPHFLKMSVGLTMEARVQPGLVRTLFLLGQFRK
uniref:Uncharacterized protein n=1 Tax=Anguilla anguilla TaxID=7936 RepID=A0A0E9WV42_ANGAN